MSKLIFGCGYLGQRVAERWRDTGAEVTIVTRSVDKAQQLRSAGFRTLVADIAGRETLPKLPEAESVLYSVGFDRSAGSSIRQVYTGGMRNVLSALSDKTARLIYISTTGVYGSSEGEWVDEQTPTNPRREGAKASLEVERLIDARPTSGQAIVLRLAGLYGPGRVPYQEKLRVGQPLNVPSSGWLNLIHVEDASSTVVAADDWAGNVERANSGGEDRRPTIFCVCDGHPVVRGDYYREVARLLGTAEPRYESPGAESSTAVRTGEDKRISNRKMLLELGVRLAYPSYREGLAAILSRE